MKLRISFWLGSFAILTLGLAARAQDIPGLPPVGAAAAPAAAAGPNLFTMLLPPPEMREKCRRKLCKCEIVKMLAAGMAPASLATGGLIPVGNCCPTVRPEDLAKPAESSQGAAARIKQDLEEAAARREAVRFLSTVDCRYWPEAEEALINALRADKIECVRYEAAVALQRGCCCTKAIAEALTICIEGSKKDGRPAERSARVRDAAAVALSMCVFEDTVDPVQQQKDKEKPVASIDPKEYYKKIGTVRDEEVYGRARTVLAKRSETMNSTQVLRQTHRASSYGLLGMISHAVESTNESAMVHSPMTREPQAIVASQPQQPQRRGLLYKLMPGAANEEYVYQPTYVPASPTPQPVRQSLPNEIRSVGWVNGSSMPTNGTITTEEPTQGFSTALPQTPAATPRPAPIPTSSAPPAARPDQGLLGFVIMDDAPRR